MILTLHGQTTFYNNIVNDIRIASEVGFEALEIIIEKLLRYLNAGLNAEDLGDGFWSTEPLSPRHWEMDYLEIAQKMKKRLEQYLEQ